MRVIFASFLAMLFAFPVYAQDARTEIDKQTVAFNQAYTLHDFKTLSEFYYEDAVVYPQGSEVIKGREGIRKLWESYEKDMTAVLYQTVEVIDAGDYAVQFGKYDATIQGKPDHGRYETVWKKDDGTWKIIRDSWYSNGGQ